MTTAPSTLEGATTSRRQLEVTGDMDELATTYWEAVAEADVDEPTSIAATPGVTWARLRRCIIDAGRIDPIVERVVVETVARHPAIGAERAWTWARGTDNHDSDLLATRTYPSAQRGAIVNPHNGPHVDTIANSRGHSVIADLLANPAADTAFVDRQLHAFPSLVLAHPNCSPEHLCDTEGRPHYYALANPALDPALAHAILTCAPATVAAQSRERCAAARHPGIATRDLEDVLASAHTAPLNDQRLIDTLNDVLAERYWHTDPWHQPAIGLRYHAHMPLDVAQRIAALTDTQRSAIRPLLDQGFGGTVTELIDVTTTF